MITKDESLEKVINKHFNHLEHKVDNLSKELVLKEIENFPDKRDSRFSPFVEERYNEHKYTVKEYLKGNLKELGSAENDKYKVIILDNFKMLYIKKDNPNYPIPVGSWMDWWEYDHEKYFGVSEKYYKLLPLNNRAELESKLQLKSWIDREYYISYAKFYLPQEHDKWWWDEDGSSKQIKDFNYGNEYWKQILQKREFTIPLEQAWKMREKHAYPGGMEQKRTSESMKKLKESMKNKGWNEPIEITRKEFESGILSEGKHRLIIAKELGIKDVPIKIVDDISNLTGKDIFNITTTGMSYYNAMIQKGHIVGNRDPVEYSKTNKRLVFEIEWMSPNEYLEKSFEIHKKILSEHEDKKYAKLWSKVSIKLYLKNNINFELVEQYKERTLSGSKMPIPILDYNYMSQEGRHRAVVAQQLNVEEIPVLVVRPYEE